jgi:hypothetical protein
MYSMKQSFIFPFWLAATLATSSLFAGTAETIQPEEAVEKAVFLSEVIRGGWVGQYNEQVVFYRFGASGKGSAIVPKPLGALHERAIDWDIAYEEGHYALRVEDAYSHEAVRYTILVLDERRLLARDAQGNQLSLVADDRLSPTEVIDRELELSASVWRTGYNGDFTGEAAMPTTAELSLRADGTYQRMFDNGLRATAETGTWALAHEGNFLLFRPEGTGEVRAARIVREGEGELRLYEAFESAEAPLHFSSPLQRLSYEPVRPAIVR